MSTPRKPPTKKYVPGWRQLAARTQFITSLRRLGDQNRAALDRLVRRLRVEGVPSTEVRKLLRGAEERLRAEEAQVKKAQVKKTIKAEEA